jgi:ribosome-binding factor A
MSIRVEKVGSLVKEELGQMFQRTFSMSEYGFFTVTDVVMSPDLRIAKVYVSVYGDDAQKKKTLALLEGQKPSIRSMLGKVIRIRFTPDLLFFLDESIDRAMRIEKIFKKIHESDVVEKDDTPEEA